MSDKTDDQNRLLIATFIVATAIAVMQIQIHINVAPSHFLTLILGAPTIGLIASAIFAFLFVISKGYELRYKIKKNETFLDKWNFIFYNISLIIYFPTVLIIGLLYLYSIFYPRAVDGDMEAMVILYSLALISVVISNLRHVREWLYAIRIKCRKLRDK